MLAVGLIALALSGPIAYSNTAGDLIRSSTNGSDVQTLRAGDGATALQALVISPDGKSVLALADGATVLFVRGDSSSENSDFNSASSADPVADDIFELWSVARDGSGAAVIAEGDFETLALMQPASPEAAAAAAAVKVTVVRKGARYVVRWTGSATSWLVTLKVGKTKATAAVPGAVHSHTFTLQKAKGAVSVKVSSR